MENNSLPSLKDVIKEYDLRAKKSLGQNFLLDSNITDKIVRDTVNFSYPKIDYENATILEIGSGPGGLTRSILNKKPKILYALEKDERCIKALNFLKSYYGQKLQIIPKDALDIKIKDICDEKVNIIANLPYNISTKLLTNWLTELENIETMTLMFQKEVALRLLAKPKTKQYGRLSIITQWLTEVKPLFDLPPQAFTPPPKVTSTVLLLKPRQKPLFEAEIKKLEKVTSCAFNQRRKMLRSSLKALGNPFEICKKADIDPSLRAEELQVEEFCKIANVI